MLKLEFSQIIIQIISFLIMLWIMKKYGWKPLLDTLEQRKNKIADEFDLIAKKKQDVEGLKSEYQKKLADLDFEGRKKIQEAIQEGRKMSAEIQMKAQEDAKETMQKAKAEIESEINKAKNRLKNEMVGQIIHTTEKILQEKMDGPAQEKLINNFVEEV